MSQRFSQSIFRRSRRKLRTALLAAMCVFLIAHAALAQKVVLIAQKGATALVLEALHRLEGELKVHDFHVVVREVDREGPLSPAELAAIAEEEGAVASVAIINSTEHTTADVWLSDRVTGKTSIRTLEAPNAEESPSVLAIRAVDLLRLSLRELSPEKPLPEDVVGAHPDRAPQHVRDWAKEEPGKHPWQLRVEAMALSHTNRMEPGFGILASLGRQLGSGFSLRGVFAGPTQGSKFEGTQSSAKLRQTLGQAELAWGALPAKWFRYELTLSAGFLHSDVVAEAEAPYVPEGGSAWSFAGSGGAGVAVLFAPQVAWGLNLRAFGAAPAIAIALDSNRAELSPLLVCASTGISVSF